MPNKQSKIMTVTDNEYGYEKVTDEAYLRMRWRWWHDDCSGESMITLSYDNENVACYEWQCFSDMETSMMCYMVQYQLRWRTLLHYCSPISLIQLCNV